MTSGVVLPLAHPSSQQDKIRDPDLRSLRYLEAGPLPLVLEDQEYHEYMTFSPLVGAQF